MQFHPEAGGHIKFDMTLDPKMNCFEALQCPFCSGLYVDGLWSLIAHSNTTHASKPIPLDFHSLSGLKKVVPKAEICAIRPAFTETGDQTNFLHYLSNVTNIETPKPQDSKLAEHDGPEFSDVESEARKFIEQAALAIFSQSINFAMPVTAPPSTSDQLLSPDLAAVSRSTQAEPSSFLNSSKNDNSNFQSARSSTKKLKRSTPYSTRTQKKQACPTCGELFDNRCQLTLHMMKHKRVSHPLKCPMAGCFQCYDTRAKIRSHLQRVHRGLTVNNIENMVLKCGTPKMKPSIPSDRDSEPMEE